MTKIKHVVSSGNVFADLGIPDPEVHQLKARLVSALARMIKQQGVTQVEAAERMQMAQPDVSRLLKGQFRAYSVERILRCIAAFGSDVTITITPLVTEASATPTKGSAEKKVQQRQGRIAVHAPA